MVAAATLIALLVFRRWRHLFTFLGSMAVLEIVSNILYDTFQRPRPYGVTIIGRWSGFSMPSPPVAVLSALLIGDRLHAGRPGRPRTVAKWAVAAAHRRCSCGPASTSVSTTPPTSSWRSTLGVAIPLLAFRLFTPNEAAFPVTYRQGKTAHLDVAWHAG